MKTTKMVRQLRRLLVEMVLGHKETVDYVTNHGVSTGWRQYEYRLASDSFQTTVLVHLFYDVEYDKTRLFPVSHEQQRQRQPRRAAR